jgi:hypothetical protein
MQVKIKVTGNVFGLFGIMLWKGWTGMIDEKQAELMEQAGVAEIIEKPEPITKQYKGRR